MNKKGDGDSVRPVMLLIVALAVGLTILGLSTGIFSLQKDQSDIESCRLSFLALSKFENVNNLADLQLNCPRVTKKVDTRILSKDSIDESELFDIVSSELYTCYQKTGKGAMNPLGSSDQGLGSKNICIICSELVFEEKIFDISKDNPALTNFVDYLYTHRIPKSKEFFSEVFNFTSFDLTIKKEEPVMYVVWRYSSDTWIKISTFVSGDEKIGYDIVKPSKLFEVDKNGKPYCNNLLN